MHEDLAFSLGRLENRRCPRSKANHAIAIQSPDLTLTAVCVDYGEGGFGAIVEGELPIGGIVSVEFNVAHREKARLQVKTIYRKDSRYGFEFVAPAGSQRQTIAEFFRESLEGD